MFLPPVVFSLELRAMQVYVAIYTSQNWYEFFLTIWYNDPV